MADKVVKIFDASLQEEVDHVVTVNDEGEIVATSKKTERIIKFPAGSTTDELKGLIQEHRTANEGHEVLTPEILEAKTKLIEASKEAIENL